VSVCVYLPLSMAVAVSVWSELFLKCCQMIVTVAHFPLCCGVIQAPYISPKVGEMPDMARPLASAYNPIDVEDG
jgi:hypothetical protein